MFEKSLSTSATVNNTSSNSICPSNTCALARLRGQRKKSTTTTTTNNNGDNAAAISGINAANAENRRQRQLNYTPNATIHLRQPPHDYAPSQHGGRKKAGTKKSTHRFKSTGIVASTAVQPKLRGGRTAASLNGFNAAAMAGRPSGGGKQTASLGSMLAGPTGFLPNPNQHQLQPINQINTAGSLSSSQSKVKRFVRNAKSQLKLFKSSVVGAATTTTQTPVKRPAVLKTTV